MRFATVELSLPDWLVEFFEGSDAVYPVTDDRMRLVIDLSRMNVERGTGGPFGAAVFEKDSGKLLAPGVNLVTSANCSAAHAEVVAISVAQRVIGDFDLGGPGQPSYELAASTEPCAMCLGATPWSGVRSLVCGARSPDAEKIGFDEGLKPQGWEKEFEKRGIAVKKDVLREEAASVLEEYATLGGEVYNSREGS